MTDVEGLLYVWLMRAITGDDEDRAAVLDEYLAYAESRKFPVPVDGNMKAMEIICAG